MYILCYLGINGVIIMLFLALDRGELKDTLIIWLMLPFLVIFNAVMKLPRRLFEIKFKRLFGFKPLTVYDYRVIGFYDKRRRVYPLGRLVSNLFKVKPAPEEREKVIKRHEELSEDE